MTLNYFPVLSNNILGFSAYQILQNIKFIFYINNIYESLNNLKMNFT